MTEQKPEFIIIGGHIRHMDFNPYQPGTKFPEDHPEIDVVRPRSMSTALWREYQGTWTIKNDKLYILSFAPGGKFKKGDDPIFADWFTGVLHVRMSRWIDLSVEDGVVINIRFNDIPNVEITREYLKEMGLT